MKGYRSLRAVKIGFFVVAATVVFGFLVQALWNELMPVLFGLHTITFWQALGLFLLSKILFGGFHRGGGGGRGRQWRQHMQKRWEGMSAEEREKFRAGMGERRGWCRPDRVEPVG
jgi:hypothetical protein